MTTGLRRLLRRRVFLLTSVGALCLPMIAWASGEVSTADHATVFAKTFLWIAVILIAAKVSGLVERFGQPAVLGELVMGVILGNLALLGLMTFEPIKSNEFIVFLAELGVVILLFQVGLESNVQKMKQVGVRALLVATVGVVVPFVLGTWVVGPWLLPDLSFNGHLFLGATLTATSVGITARVFQDLKRLQTREAQIVLGAAVIDDVMGLIILAVVSAIVSAGTVSLGDVTWIFAKALIFLGAAIVIGQRLSPWASRMFSRIHSGTGMKFSIAVAFGLIMAFLAKEIDLAPIVGAFAAGLILDPVHFKNFEEPEVTRHLREATFGQPGKLPPRIIEIADEHAEKHVEDLLKPVAFFLVPIFFVLTGMSVNLETMFDLKVLGIALVITAIAFAGKLVAGLAAGNVSKWAVGWGMVPRGEVGLIFATTGKALGVVSDTTFSVIVIVVILTTLLTPPILSAVLKRQKTAAVDDATSVAA